MKGIYVENKTTATILRKLLWSHYPPNKNALSSGLNVFSVSRHAEIDVFWFFYVIPLFFRNESESSLLVMKLPDMIWRLMKLYFYLFFTVC